MELKGFKSSHYLGKTVSMQLIITKRPNTIISERIFNVDITSPVARWANAASPRLYYYFDYTNSEWGGESRGYSNTLSPCPATTLFDAFFSRYDLTLKGSLGTLGGSNCQSFPIRQYSLVFKNPKSRFLIFPIHIYIYVRCKKK